MLTACTTPDRVTFLLDSLVLAFFEGNGLDVPCGVIGASVAALLICGAIFAAWGALVAVLIVNHVKTVPLFTNKDS
jgi:hypothetical protein